jgi:predicted Zn-dependent peptidase
LRSAFQEWRPGAAASGLPAMASESSQLLLVDSPGAPQSSVRIAVPVPDPSHALYFPTTLMNSLLGGTFGSRITANIREDKGYSYSPGSSISARRGGALWILSAEVTAQHTAAALTEIFREIERLQRETPADTELTPVKNYRAGVFVIANSSPGGVLGQLAFMDLHGLPEDFLTRWVASIRAVTPEQVSEMARQYIRPERMSVVVAGDVAKIGEDVRALPQFATARMP